MILDRFSLEGKTAVVTGGGTGLGKAMCHALARAGADIVVASRSQAHIDETASEVKSLGQRSIAVPTDITISKQVDNLIKKSIETFGKIDIFINNAGIARGIEPSPRDPVPILPSPIWDLTDDKWHVAIDTNLTGTFYCCRAIARHMIEHGRGKVINISSLAGVRAARGLFTYCTAKAGVVMLTKTLAMTWADHNIQVNCIAPGVFTTPEADPVAVEKQSRFIAMGRCGDPKEIGPLAVFLASDASDYITGECFIIDGGKGAGYGPTGFAMITPLTG
ncbi:SDR family NAD(P)-dependent oxidoreductase [Thermodesulfobacteriota bacterium]